MNGRTDPGLSCRLSVRLRCLGLCGVCLAGPWVGLRVPHACVCVCVSMQSVCVSRAVSVGGVGVFERERERKRERERERKTRCVM